MTKSYHGILLRRLVLSLIVLISLRGYGADRSADPPMQFSGIYPHLAMYNHNNECGIGAVVPWAGKLWVITYGPHKPQGSDDKLYMITPDLKMETYSGSVGGTPADRMIHRESQQLIIGPYFIDQKGKVRTITPKQMPGRITAVARHLTQPAEKVYFYTMEEGIYEVDVHTLAVKTINQDGNARNPVDIAGPLLPGYHGKGAYSSQKRLIVANNGEKLPWQQYMQPGPSGCLAQWDGKKWDIIERKQFCEVTGPGGIYGNKNPNDPIWATGWDSRSVILKLLDKGKWYSYRLPKASYTYDGRHGWHTEWPRIRQIGQKDLLMIMHGMFWRFPASFSRNNTAGVLPRSSYLKIIGDFCSWNGKVVLGCDDASTLDNPLCGQSNSNLVFLKPEQLDNFGPRQGFGGVWVNDQIKAHYPSDPFLLAGFDQRVVHLWHNNDKPVNFTIEIDKEGNNHWEKYRTITVGAGQYLPYIFPENLPGQWVRISTDQNCDQAGAYFHYTDHRWQTDTARFTSLARINNHSAYSVGLIRPRGADMKSLHFAAQKIDQKGNLTEAGYYEIGNDLKLHAVNDPDTCQWLKNKAKIKTPDFSVDQASVVVIDKQNRRWRLPRGARQFDQPFAFGWPRGIREVATERSLFNCQGTFYELPRDISGGMAGIKPICTHNRIISDYCSWRGMLVLTGNKLNSSDSRHFIGSDDGQAGLWLGSIDDLWKLGKPRGQGGPWKYTAIQADQPSDPYLMTGFDRKTLTINHNCDTTVKFRLEVDVTGQGIWLKYQSLTVPPGEKYTYNFAPGFSAHWIRIVSNKNCTATAWFTYK